MTRWRTCNRRRRRPSWEQWTLRPRYLGVVNGCYVFVTHKRLVADVREFAAQFDADMVSAIAACRQQITGATPELQTQGPEAER